MQVYTKAAIIMQAHLHGSARLRLPGAHFESHRLAPLGFLLNRAARHPQEFVFGSLAGYIFRCGEARTRPGKMNFRLGIVGGKE